MNTYADDYITITSTLVTECRLDVDREVFSDDGDEVDAGSFGYAWGDGPWSGGFGTEGDAFEADEAAFHAQG